MKKKGFPGQISGPGFRLFVFTFKKNPPVLGGGAPGVFSIFFVAYKKGEKKKHGNQGGNPKISPGAYG